MAGMRQTMIEDIGLPRIELPERIIDSLKCVSDSKIAVVVWHKVFEVRHSLRSRNGRAIGICARFLSKRLAPAYCGGGAEMPEPAPRCRRRCAQLLIQATLSKTFCGNWVPTEAELAQRERRDVETAHELLERVHDERHRATNSPGRNSSRRSASVARNGGGP